MLSERAVKVLFAYVQQQDPDSADDFGNAVEDDDSEMVISEFKEALAAIGGQLYPDPYNVFDMKLSKFLRKEVVTKALKLQRFRKLGAPPRGLKPIRRLSLEGSNSTGRISPTESLESRGGAERIGSERRGSGSKREVSEGEERSDELKRALLLGNICCQLHF